ncbi:MAG: hypothetical protein LBF27_14320 [Sphingobacterium sp.]|jgi:hypothetical protein|nr:hypothetical protein [Sphingobacterium sp.]
MKVLLFIFLSSVSQSLSAQQKEIPEHVKITFAGVWQYKNKYQTNTVEIRFERGKDYALFRDVGNGMAPARVLRAKMQGKQLIIQAQWQKNDDVAMEVINRKLYLHTKPIQYDEKGNILKTRKIETRVFNRVAFPR